MNIFNSDMIARAIQKRDKTRVALRKSACGAVMIDGLAFSVSVESDGAADKKGVVFTLSGDAVHDGRLVIPMVEATFPTTSSTKTIKRKPEIYKTKEGKSVYRCAFPEIKIPECSDPEQLAMTAVTEEQLMNATRGQIIFRFTQEYKSPKESEVMVNIYPSENPLEGSCTEWVMVTSDAEFFEHGGLKKLMNAKKGKKQ
ncbi:MAG: hypothetical protein IJ723_03645 [Ruminococcus sp.]|nr:hypothetical protein [Ruminococcus sp.]